MAKKSTIPGVVKPADAFRTTDEKSGPKSIEQKRATVIDGIGRYRRGEGRSYRLEAYNHEQGVPVIRVLYGTMPLAIFGGKPAAVIEQDADRDVLWDAIVDKIRAGEYDEEIERVAQEMLRSIRQARSKKRTAPKAA